MSENPKKLYIYEALELQREYEERIKILSKLISDLNHIIHEYRDDDTIRLVPISDMNQSEVKDKIRELEYKQRKLNNAIQYTNQNQTIEINNETMTLAEALHLKKSTGNKIKINQKELKSASYGRIIYKENRDIKELPGLSFNETEKRLEYNYLLFREINIKLRKISFEVTIDFTE